MIIAVYAQKENRHPIAQVLNEVDAQMVEGGAEKLIDCMDAIARVKPDVLILDVAAVEEQDYDSAAQAVQKLRMLCDATQTIVLVPDDVQPGNRLVSRLVDMGVWDIVQYSAPETLKMAIIDQLGRRSSYSSAARWQRHIIDAAKKAETAGKEKVVTIIRTETVVKHVRNRYVMFVNCTARAGSSLISSSFARHLAKSGVDTGLVELDVRRPYLYNLLAQKHNILRDYDGEETDPLVIIHQYNSMHHAIAKRCQSVDKTTKYNADGLITLYAPDPLLPRIDAAAWSSEMTEELLDMAVGHAVTVVDAGSRYNNDSIQPCLRQMDALIVLIEPLTPDCYYTDVVAGLRDLRELGYPVWFLFNRVTAKSDLKTISKHLGIEDALVVPAIDTAVVQGSINRGKYVYDTSIGMKKAMSVLAAAVLPVEINQQKNTRRGFSR